MNIRMVSPHDITALAEIEEWNFRTSEVKQNWESGQFVRFIGNKNTVVIVAEEVTGVIGFVAYEIATESIVIVRLGVRMDSKRHGVGTNLLDYVNRAAHLLGIERLLAVVIENDLESQAFYQAAGGTAALAKELFEERDGLIFTVPVRPVG